MRGRTSSAHKQTKRKKDEARFSLAVRTLDTLRPLLFQSTLKPRTQKGGVDALSSTKIGGATDDVEVVKQIGSSCFRVSGVKGRRDDDCTEEGSIHKEDNAEPTGPMSSGDRKRFLIVCCSSTTTFLDPRGFGIGIALQGLLRGSGHEALLVAKIDDIQRIDQADNEKERLVFKSSYTSETHKEIAKMRASLHLKLLNSDDDVISKCQRIKQLATVHLNKECAKLGIKFDDVVWHSDFVNTSKLATRRVVRKWNWLRLLWIGHLKEPVPVNSGATDTDSTENIGCWLAALPTELVVQIQNHVVGTSMFSVEALRDKPFVTECEDQQLKFISPNRVRNEHFGMLTRSNGTPLGLLLDARILHDLAICNGADSAIIIGVESMKEHLVQVKLLLQAMGYPLEIRSYLINPFRYSTRAGLASFMQLLEDCSHNYYGYKALPAGMATLTHAIGVLSGYFLVPTYAWDNWAPLVATAQYLHCGYWTVHRARKMHKEDSGFAAVRRFVHDFEQRIKPQALNAELETTVAQCLSLVTHNAARRLVLACIDLRHAEQLAVQDPCKYRHYMQQAYIMAQNARSTGSAFAKLCGRGYFDEALALDEQSERHQPTTSDPNATGGTTPELEDAELTLTEKRQELIGWLLTLRMGKRAMLRMMRLLSLEPDPAFKPNRDLQRAKYGDIVLS